MVVAVRVVSMTPAEAFAVIPLAAVSADNRLQPEEASLLNTQLRGHSPYREMNPVAFGTMVSSILLALQEGRTALLEEAIRLLSLPEQEKAYAFAARIVHADRIATPEETRLLAEVGGLLAVPAERLRQIEASFALLSPEAS
jgi:hypothetical protein